MKGYKIPEGWAIGWRNAIERYPKDSEYAWGMNAVLESIEAFPLEELDENPWHTGTPSEEGWYVVAYECVFEGRNKGKLEYHTMHILEDEFGHKDIRGRTSDYVWKAVAWQKIEPYKENQDGRTY